MDFHKLIYQDNEFDPDLLDKACIQFTTSDPNDPVHEELNQILIQFSERPDNFNFCFPVINGDCHTYTKFLAYQILKKNIIKNWIRYPVDETENIRHMILRSIVKMVQEGQKPFTLSMANQALIEILKYDWPENWPLFISELSETCKDQGIQFLKNGLDILKMLADDITPSKNLGGISSSDQLTKDRQRKMQTQFINELNAIYSIIESALCLNNDPSQFNPTDLAEINSKLLSTLKSFIPVAGTDRLLHTPIISAITPLLMNDVYTYQVFSIFGKFCEDLSQSSTDNTVATTYKDSMLAIFHTSLEKIYSMIGEQINFNCMEDDDIILLVRGIYDFLNLFISVMEFKQNEKEIHYAISWIIQITNCSFYDKDNDLIFSELIRFWHFICITYYRSITQENSFKDIFSSAISTIITYLVKNVVSPYSFIEFSSNTNNRVQNSLSLDSYESSLYDTMKETLIILYHLKKDELFGVISSQISLIQSNQFQAETINSISWTIGAIAKVITPEENTSMMNLVVPIFIQLINAENPSNIPTIEEIRLTTSKALLFMCSQEARYFRNNPEFLGSLMQMILKFLISESSHLNIIAIHTFNSLSKSCKQTFLVPTPPSNEMIISGILTDLPTFINQMRPEHRSIFISSIADIIFLYVSSSIGYQRIILDNFLNQVSSIFLQSYTLVETTASRFNAIVTQISGVLSALNENDLTLTSGYQFQPLSLIDLDLLKNLINVINILIAIPLNLKTFFLPFFLTIADKLVRLYEMATSNSAMITSTDFTNETNPNVINLANSSLDYYNELANLIAELYKNILRVTKSSDQEFLPILISAFFIGLNYQSLPPQCCPASILSMYSSLFQYIYSQDIENAQISGVMMKMLYEIFGAIYMKTAEIIKDEYDTYYDLRIGMCDFINGIIRGKPDFIFMMNDEQIDILIQMIFWLTNHPYEQISTKAVELCFLLIQAAKDPSVIQNRQAAEAFFNKYLIVIISQMFSLLSDSTYKFGFDIQTLVLNSLFQMPDAQQQFNLIEERANAIFNQNGCGQFIRQLFDKASVLLGFRSLMKDFLIQLKQYSSNDPELCAVEIFKKKRMETLERENIRGLNPEEQIRPEDVENNVSFLSNLLSEL